MGFFEDNYQYNLSNNYPHIMWEYEEVHLSINNTTLFNALGKQGWEMCGYDGQHGVAVFKRIKR